MRRALLFVVALTFFLTAGLAPRKAAADIVDNLLISAYVAGGVAAITLIAILLAGNIDDEPEFDALLPAKSKDAAPAGFAVGCRAPDGSVALACW